MNNESTAGYRNPALTGLPAKTYRKHVLASSLAVALTLPMATMAFAQDAATAEEEEAQAETTQLDAVVVTGSRIKRAEIEGPAPVVIITSEDLKQEGFSTVYDALNTLTQFTGSVQNELNQNGFTPNASFINLRGLGPGYSLILINGRRAADYPLPYNSQSNAVNLANIPAAAIERIEILTGGASAIYGSDAVAGVVNVILKSNFEGDDVTLRAGTSTRGGGDIGNFSWVGGRSGDRWSLTYAVELLEREELFASQREFMDSYLDQPGIDPNDINPVEGLLVFDGFTSGRITVDDPIETCNRFEEFDIFYFEQSSVYTGPRCGYFGYPATQAIRNSDSNQSGFVTGTFDFTDNLQGFAQLFVTRAEAKLASNTQFWQSPGSFVFDPNLESAALGPGGGAFVQVQRIFTPAEVGGRDAQASKFVEKSYDLAFGLRGTMFDNRFDWDATLSHSEYQLDSEQPRFLENAVNNYFLGAQTGLDPYFNYYPMYEMDLDRLYNPISPEDFRSLNTLVKDTADSSITQASFVFSGDIFELPAGPVGMALVLEGAAQDYVITPDARTATDYTGPEPIYNLASTRGGGDRDRYAMGLEFSVPVLETLKANMAARYDYFNDASDISGASTWQIGLEWRPMPALLIRASHNTSFRAPDMHYIYAGESGFFTTIKDEFRCRADGFDPNPGRGEVDNCVGPRYVYGVGGTRSGDPDLKAEKGKSTTIGFVWDISDDMSFSMDYYDIELEDAVGDISGLLFRNEADCLLGVDRNGNPVDQTSEFCDFYTGLVNRGNAGPIVGAGAVNDYRSFPINQTYNGTTGIDASFTYGLDTDRYGNFGFELSWTHVLELEDQEFPGQEIRELRDNLQFFNFRSRMTAALSWEKGDYTANIYGTRTGSLPNWGETGRIAPNLLWNINGSKQITNNFRVGLYVNNVFDKIAPRDDSFNTYPYFWRAFSPVGREVFLEMNYVFK